MEKKASEFDSSACHTVGKIKSLQRAKPGPEMGRERKEIKGMRNRVGEQEHECGRGGGGRAGQWLRARRRRASAFSRDCLIYPQRRPGCVTARGQRDREEVQWEGLYANISLSLLLGILNTV